MARKRVAPFEPPTAADFDLRGPELVRRGPRGGFMWLCEKDGCQQSASHLSAAGVKVCKRHGGSTAAQRDPVRQAEVVAAGGEPSRAPGRPVEHGRYATTTDRIDVDATVQAYRDGHLDPDATDDDMLYLRAYLEEFRRLRPDAMEAYTALQDALPVLQAMRRWVTDEVVPLKGKLTMDDCLEIVGRLHQFERDLGGLSELFKTLMLMTMGIEERHRELIRLAKVRAETRLKNSAAMQLDVFTVMVKRLALINAETLPSHFHEALQMRYARELSELPASAVKVTN